MTTECTYLANHKQHGGGRNPFPGVNSSLNKEARLAVPLACRNLGRKNYEK
jgi:hypothetical protein